MGRRTKTLCRPLKGSRRRAELISFTISLALGGEATGKAVKAAAVLKGVRNRGLLSQIHQSDKARML